MGLWAWVLELVLHALYWQSWLQSLSVSKTGDRCLSGKDPFIFSETHPPAESTEAADPPMVTRHQGTCHCVPCLVLPFLASFQHSQVWPYLCCSLDFSLSPWFVLSGCWVFSRYPRSARTFEIYGRNPGYWVWPGSLCFLIHSACVCWAPFVYQLWVFPWGHLAV